MKRTEAPHIYRRNGYYYLITPEGGSGTGHAVTVARSKHLAGPYEVDPQNPMLTSRDQPELPLQCAGHGSLVETPDGEWYMAHLCTRPIDGEYAILGRETALQQVYWNEEGWLRLTAGGHTPRLEVPAPVGSYEAVVDQNHSIFEDMFEGPQLKKTWNSLRILVDDNWCSLTERPGYLRLTAGESIQSLFHHHIIAIRQRDKHFRAETSLEYHPTSYLNMSGMLLYLNEDRYLYAYISYEEGQGKVLRMMKCEGDTFTLVSEVIVLEKDAPIYIAVEVNETHGQFYYHSGDKSPWEPLFERQNISFLSGGFTGNFVGIAAHDMQQFQGSYADFAFFRYVGKDD
ncbi:Beta-xylosidase [compost metagenome]